MQPGSSCLLFGGTALDAAVPSGAVDIFGRVSCASLIKMGDKGDAGINYL